MKLIKETTRGWEAERIAETPVGIEQLDRGCWLVYRVMFGERVYVMEEVIRYGQKIRDTRFFTSRGKAIAHAKQEVEKWRESIVVFA